MAIALLSKSRIQAPVSQKRFNTKSSNHFLPPRKWEKEQDSASIQCGASFENTAATFALNPNPARLASTSASPSINRPPLPDHLELLSHLSLRSSNSSDRLSIGSIHCTYDSSFRMLKYMIAKVTRFLQQLSNSRNS